MLNIITKDYHIKLTEVECKALHSIREKLFAAICPCTGQVWDKEAGDLLNLSGMMVKKFKRGQSGGFILLGVGAGGGGSGKYE